MVHVGNVTQGATALPSFQQGEAYSVLHCLFVTEWEFIPCLKNSLKYSNLMLKMLVLESMVLEKTLHCKLQLLKDTAS